MLGELISGKPWTYLPEASRLYFRKSQLPAGETFQTKTAVAVEMFRQADATSNSPILAAFDGAYAMETVVGPCLEPADTHRRIDFVTRLRCDARLYVPLVESGKKPEGDGRGTGENASRPLSITRNGTSLGKADVPISTAKTR